MKDTEKIKRAVVESWGRSSKEAEALARKIKKRDAQLAALRKDKARLDWLASELHQKDTDYRETIDAAMSHTDAREQGAAGGEG